MGKKILTDPFPMTAGERKRKSRNIASKSWKCLNPLCMKEWSEELMDADKWMQCDYCEEMFCTNEVCLGMVDQATRNSMQISTSGSVQEAEEEVKQATNVHGQIHGNLVI